MNTKTQTTVKARCKLCDEPAYCLHLCADDALWLCEHCRANVERDEENSLNQDLENAQRDFQDLDAARRDLGAMAFHGMIRDAIAAPRYVRWDNVLSQN